MYSALSPGVVGVHVDNLAQRIAAAKEHGFAGVEIDIREIATLVGSGGAEKVEAQFVDAGVIAAGWHLPVDYGGSEADWRRDLDALPAICKAAAAIDCFRAFTWVMPCSNDREYDENLKFHVERFKPVAAILEEHGIRLGLEFIGPKTIRDRFKYEFIYTMPGMLELAEKIGGNVGLLLDVWHLYTSHGEIADVAKLEETDVVYVHVNDAPRGLEIDEQQDGTRCLPGETGVIDITTFLMALQGIGYSGPLVPEPFKKELGDLPSDSARLEAVAASMRKVMI
ncbi:MAG TPA: sugar phosphate isomerase/epimerase [Fimbriimonadaceae bacterium]|nr:sugar phosphate isomerase/epimerase [Fimbriimonadaceae bacterium]